MEPDVAPAGVLSQSTRSGGAGAPLAGTMTRRQELADDAEPSGSFGSAARRCRRRHDGAPGGALPRKWKRRASQARLGQLSPSRPRGTIASASRFPALRSLEGAMK